MKTDKYTFICLFMLIVIKIVLNTRKKLAQKDEVV